jgi:hypothetical protein
MYLIKSLPSSPAAGDGEDQADGLLYTVITESTKMLPWVMDGKRQIKAYLKVRSKVLLNPKSELNTIALTSAVTRPLVFCQ